MISYSSTDGAGPIPVQPTTAVAALPRRDTGHSMSATALSKLGVCLLVLGGVSCGEGRQRSEARAFLSLYESIDHRSPAPTREAQLKRLDALVLSDETVDKARNECLSAHQTLLTAEREHEASARQLDEALAGVDGGAALPPQLTSRLQDGINKADRSLADARTRFERCENQVRDLSVRFGKN